MTFTNETLVPSTSPRDETIGETKMTLPLIRVTTFTNETLVATGSGQGE